MGDSVNSSNQNKASYRTNIVEIPGIGGNKLGVMQKAMGDAGLGIRTDISYVQTTLKQGTWGWVAQATDAEKIKGAEPGKAVGMLGVDQRGSGSGTQTYWYQIGVNSAGLAFAELGWNAQGKSGAMLIEYPDITVAGSMDLKMVPSGNTVDFHFRPQGKSTWEKRTLTWDPKSSDWNTGAGAPKLKDSQGNTNYLYWNNTNIIVSLNLQTETYWSSSSISSKGYKMELPGTSSDRVVFGPTEYESKTLGVKTIPGHEFEQSTIDPYFRHEVKGNQIEMYSSQNSEEEPK